MDSIPECPQCGIELSYADSGNRDTETMGGYEVEYLKCERCKTLYSHICGDPPNDLCEECSI
jgi:hypothetical protein